MQSDTMRNESPMPAERCSLDLLCCAFVVVGFSAWTLCASVGFAQTQPETAPRRSGTARIVSIGRRRQARDIERRSRRPRGQHHPHATAEVPVNTDALAAKLSNPSAPLLSFRTFLDTTTYRGTAAPGAAKWGFSMETQPAFPFFVGPAALILRPTIILEFGQPYVDSAGNVRKFNGIGNWQLDTLYGKTLKNGLMVMGGLSNAVSKRHQKRGAPGLGVRARGPARLRQGECRVRHARRRTPGSSARSRA